MIQPVLTWRGKLVADMTREELVTALDQSCHLLKEHQKESAHALGSIRRIHEERGRMQRVDGIFIGLIVGATAVAVITVVIFLLTR